MNSNIIIIINNSLKGLEISEKLEECTITVYNFKLDSNFILTCSVKCEGKEIDKLTKDEDYHAKCIFEYVKSKIADYLSGNSRYLKFK